MPTNENKYSRYLHILALFLMGAVFTLLGVGALVTGTGSGLAVPDWPLSYGTLFPPMRGGIFFEHGHRLVAGFVVCLTLAFVVSTFAVSASRTVKALSLSALGLVLTQAALGGLTVLMKLPISISVFHAVMAQLFFACSVTLAVVTSRAWVHKAHAGELPREPTPERGATAQGTRGWLQLALRMLFVGLVFQIWLGALVRHWGAGLAIPDFPLSFGQVWPPFWSYAIFLHYLHRTLAWVLCLSILGITTALMFKKAPAQVAAGIGLLLALVALQIGLGATIIYLGRPLGITTMHLMMAGALLGNVVVLMLWVGHYDGTQKGRLK